MMDAAHVDPFDRFERARIAASQNADVRWFFDSVDRWLRDVVECDQAAAVHSYWGMPLTPARIKRYLRDLWLARAAAEVEASGAWSGCARLADEWQTFVSRGGWDASSDDKEPPVEITSRLRQALWWASRYNNGEALKVGRLFTIEQVTSVFAARC